MVEVTSCRMECTLLTPDNSQVPAVALQYIHLQCTGVLHINYLHVMKVS